MCAQSNATLKGIFSMHTALSICEELAYLSMQDKLVYKQASQGEIEPLEKIQVPNATGAHVKEASLKCYPGHMLPHL